MAASQEESYASLRLLVCMAMADGVLHEREHDAIEEGFADADLPKGASLDALFSDHHDFDALCAEIETDEAQRSIYASMFALACVDGDYSAREKELLDRAGKVFGIEEARRQELERLFDSKSEARGGDGRAERPQMLDGMVRKQKVEEETRKSAIVCGILGAFPFPGFAIATDLAVLGLQIGLARDIGKFWGQEIDKETAKGIMTGFGVGTGARIAVTNLLKIFPGWGIAVGAASSYMSTWAVGRTMDAYFARGEGADPADLKEEFENAKAEGKAAYEADKDEVAERGAAHKDELVTLEKKLEDGLITQAEFESEASTIL